MTVRRCLGRDAATGGRRWADQTLRWKGYGSAESGLWTTGHSAQRSTATAGIAVFTGNEDAQWLYTAMTRGAEANIAWVITTAASSDPAPGTRSAPELARDRQIAAERAGQPVAAAETAGLPGAEPRDAAAVLADALKRDGRELSALETQRRNLVNADHLGKLATIWDGETRDLRIARYRQAIAAHLLAGLYDAAGQLSGDLAVAHHAGRRSGGARCQRRSRTGRARPAAGRRAQCRDRRRRADQEGRWRPDPGTVAALGPSACPPSQIPSVTRFLAELAAAMDARKDRIGEHAGQAQPQWAVNALGEVPADPLARLEWERRAAHLGAYREMYG